MPEKYMKEYSEVEDFIIEELNALPYGGLSELSNKADIDIHELSRFKNRKLKTTRPFFMTKILEALGYTNVKITSVIYYNYEKPDS